MKGVNQKLAKLSASSDSPQADVADKRAKRSQKRAKGSSQPKPLTASELSSINRRLDQCLPMETMEWQRVEQLLMQVLEFAPSNLVYETGMAVALYADDQARRAYMLGTADARAAKEDAA